MRVLLTNNTLGARAGSEMYLRDLAVGLVRHGHQPIAYSSALGAVAEDLRAASVPVVDDLGQLSVAPDVIHGQHHLETMAALVRFPGVPAVSVCHGWVPWEEYPVWHPRVRRFVAVSELLAQRLATSGIPADRIRMLGNAVDLARFGSRPGLPSEPRHALVFNNRAAGTVTAAVRQACAEAGITLDVIGMEARTPTATPEEHLPRYDLVFASGRSALEAAAVGCAVIVCDENALGAMVTTKNLDRMRAFNFGLRVLQNPLTADAIQQEITHYDRTDALAVSEAIRSTADLELLVDRMETLYREAIEEQDSDPADPDAEGRAEAAYLQWLKDVVSHSELVAAHRNELAAACERQQAELGRVTAEYYDLATERKALLSQQDRLAAQLREAAEECARLSSACDDLAGRTAAMEETATWRLRSRVLSLPRVVRTPLRLASRAASVAGGSPDQRRREAGSDD
jgi:Glycosyltransferase Family 4